MNASKSRLLAIAILTATILGVVDLRTSLAQSSPSRGITLYEDLKTGALYRKPGKGRVAVTLGLDEPATPPATVQQVDEVKKSNEALRAEFLQNQQTLLKENAELKSRVTAIEPAWTDYLNNFKNRFHVGTVIFGDYALYTHTGFGPVFIENQAFPGPGNNIYNSFDLNRAYLNFYFNPTPDWTVRLVPDIYRAFGSASPATLSRTSSVGSNLSGDLNYRIKYAYLEYNKLLDWAGDATKGSTIAIGVLPNPQVTWQEDLFGFRYVTYGPWNYLGLSSGQAGIKIEGPIKYNDLTYVDYSFGAFNNAKYFQFEESNTKQVMARVSVYPFGAKWRYQGLGVTGFYDYGYNNNPPDNSSVLTGFGANPNAFGRENDAHLTRVATILHYDTENWSFGGEWDYGHNAFPAANLFSSNGPSVFFTPPSFTFPGGVPTAAANPYTTPYYNFAAMTAAFQNNSRTVQQGFDFFGRYHLPDTKFTAFGLFQYFQPNTKVDHNPLDFYRYVAGVQYQVNEFVRIALDTQDLQFFHGQDPISTKYANSFGKVFVPVANSNAGKKGQPATFLPPSFVSDPVPRDTHELELSFEFSY